MIAAVLSEWEERQFRDIVRQLRLEDRDRRTRVVAGRSWFTRLLAISVPACAGVVAVVGWAAGVTGVIVAVVILVDLLGFLAVTLIAIAACRATRTVITALRVRPQHP